jgi:methylglyoxal synthase
MGSPSRILIAEDETITRLDICGLLERAGFDICAQARDGVEAVTLARTTVPDLAILDLRMPRLNGIEAAREIIAQRSIPIVILTAHGNDELVDRAVDAGVYSYLTKPFREADLLAAIRTARGRAHADGPSGSPRTQIALIANNGKKDELLTLVGDRLALLRCARLVATESTGALIEDTFRLEVERTASGPYGGDIEIAALVARGSIDLVVFLRDPLEAHPHESDIQALMKICDVHRVPLATNTSTATLCLDALAPMLEPSDKLHAQ